jgi:cell division protein ZapD
MDGTTELSDPAGLGDNDRLQHASPLASTTAMNQAATVFEQPLNERIRTLMRLEFLFQQAAFGVEGETEWHTRTAVQTLLDILALLGRGDLRTEMLKELERLVTTLEGWRERPEVDEERLTEFLHESWQLMESLRSTGFSPATELKSNEFLNTIIQRSGIVGGTCGFDLPGYHHWLHRPVGERRAQLRSWLDSLDILRRANEMILTLLRSSAPARTLTAEAGSYQRTLDRNTPFQLIRVEPIDDDSVFAEISANRHFCTIRFMVHGIREQRPQQTERDIEFRLYCCVL